ncbi:hypothetical protein KBB96_03510 [Luteolibacter ambystomatis]|uniref:Uncharacterized protein n=2 Tax=Luteolibacter ambystomatis TaxID=2824561 RepID=A0A975J0V2_9BACT|nr:hypothetical protein [Luteolibacter ambystomatis]QUE51961.1 hypothetical protein KBB96_03510 [Luteolibacter ambystomatis]
MHPPYASPMEDDNREKETAELIKTLAFKGLSLPMIQARLKKEGLDNQLPNSEVDRIFHQAQTGRGLVRRPGRLLPRIVGTVAVLGGITAGCIIGFLDIKVVCSILFGLILIFRPENAQDAM